MHAKNDDCRWRSDGYIFFFSFSVAHHRFFANITKNICTLQRKHSENKFQHCFCCCPHINIYMYVAGCSTSSIEKCLLLLLLLLLCVFDTRVQANIFTHITLGLYIVTTTLHMMILLVIPLLLSWHCHAHGAEGE